MSNEWLRSAVLVLEAESIAKRSTHCSSLVVRCGRSLIADL
jgi:hypothetical protein